MNSVNMFSYNYSTHSARLCIHNFCPSILDPLCQFVQFIISKVHSWLGLQQRMAVCSHLPPQTNRRMDRQTDRQTDRHTDTDRCVQLLTCERRGRMVTPECPPITGTDVLVTSNPLASATKVFDRTMSRVVTPNMLRDTMNTCQVGGHTK